MQEELQNFISEGTPEDVIARYEKLPELAETFDFGEYDENIVVIDTETTGVSVKKDELTQIAAARLEHGKITDWYVTFVNPGKPIPYDVAHLTNIHDEDVADAPSPQEALQKLVEFVGDAKLVAHNADFDRGFTTKHPEGYPLLENQWIDSLELARIALPKMKSHRLIDLISAFGGPKSTHRADDDVEATCVLYRILLAAVISMPESLIYQISILASPDEWPMVKIFSYFAWKKASLRTPDADTVLPETFSLRALRRERARQVEHKAKCDAATMISEELAENTRFKISADEGGAPAILKFPTPEEITDAFSKEGIVGSLYDDFETRVEQLEMAAAIRDSFADSVNLMVEAGTGVGKSMAYLVPAALSALKNNITIGVATKTNALLDQLVYKELPALSAALDHELNYCSLKGYSHYPCLRKVEKLYVDGAQMRLIINEEKSQAPAIAGVLSFIEQSAYEDLDTLKIDFRLLPRRAITTTSHDCLRRKCPFYGTTCFVHGSRRRAEESDIVVTNHSLLFCDVAADGGLLPPIRYWIVDEAHGAENEARQALSLEISADALNKLAQWVGVAEGARNIFNRAERNISVPEAPDENLRRAMEYAASQAKTNAEPEDDTASVLDLAEQELSSAQTPQAFFVRLLAKAKSTGRKFSEEESTFVSHMRDLLFFDPQKRSGYDTVEIWVNDEVRASTIYKELSGYARSLLDASENLIHACQNLVGFLEDIDGAAQMQREIASVALDLKDFVIAATEIFIHPTDEYVFSATLSKKPDKGNNVLRALLYNVGSRLDETLYARTHSIIFTSATLTVNGSFAPFATAMGLNTSPQSKTNELQLASSYDFDQNMTVYVVNDMPEPNSAKYLEQLQKMLVDAHLAQNGSMLTLFTNKKEMEACFSEVAPPLKDNDLRLVCQRWGVSVKGLRDDFLKDETLSLFALKSFWEGFDAPGSTLRGVIIPKLPFSKPTDPLSCERATRDEGAWRHFVLPQAVLEVRQAAGRLIRKADDTGVLILADSRLVSKGYGKVFINSLPSKNVHYVSSDEVVEALVHHRHAAGK